MAVPTTPAEWLPILARRLDAQAAHNAPLRAYATGTQPGPQMTERTRKSWQKFQAKARVLYGALACETLAARIRATGVTVGTGEHEDAEERARIIWRRNRLETVIADAILDSFIVGRAFFLNARDSFGRVRVTFESSDWMTVETDPLDELDVRAGLKVWRDGIAGTDHARVWLPGIRQDFVRPSTDDKKHLRASNAGDWQPVGDPVESDPTVPITPLINRGGTGEFESATWLLDRISDTILQRLVVVAFQAARLRAVRNLPVDEADDETGETTSASVDELFDASPGALLDIGDAEIWEGAVTDPRPILDAAKDDVREFASSTGTPVTALLPDSANQSAAGAAAPFEQQNLKARDRIARFGPVVEGVLLKALRSEYGPEFDQPVSVAFAEPELTTETERAAASVAAKADGVPWRVRMARYYGYSPDEIDAMEEALQDEALTASLAALSTQPAE